MNILFTDQKPEGFKVRHSTDWERDKEQRDVRNADKEIEALQKAQMQYEKDGDLGKCIEIYEKYLLKTPYWNCFNYRMLLVELYLKEGEWENAWGLLGRMEQETIDRNYEIMHIREKQYKIPRGNKQYLSALEIYSVWYVMKTNTSHGNYFVKDDYIKGGKTMAKGVGLTEEQFAELAGRIENMVRSGKDISEDKVIAEYRQFITETGIWDFT